MINVDLKNIKAKSIRAVFLSIASSQKTTRAEIARDTGLSLMTVGKIADILTRAGITEEEKESSGAVGRRASSIRISGLYYGIILDVSSDTYICEIVDAATKTMDQFSYAYNRDYYKEENLLLFLKNLSLYLSTRYDPEKCFGIGVIEEKFLRGTSAKKFTASAQESDSASIRKETQKALAQYSQSISGCRAWKLLLITRQVAPPSKTSPSFYIVTRKKTYKASCSYKANHSPGKMEQSEILNPSLSTSSPFLTNQNQLLRSQQPSSKPPCYLIRTN